MNGAIEYIEVEAVAFAREHAAEIREAKRLLDLDNPTTNDFLDAAYRIQDIMSKRPDLWYV